MPATIDHGAAKIPPMVAYVYAADRNAERPAAHLDDFAGILQIDGYGAYTALIRRRQQVRLAFYWAHGPSWPEKSAYIRPSCSQAKGARHAL